MLNWQSPETLEEIKKDFELLLTLEEHESLLFLAMIRHAYDKEAMKTASKMLTIEQRKQLFHLTSLPQPEIPKCEKS